MTTLHVVNHPDALQSCLQLAADGDAVLLIEAAAGQLSTASSSNLERPVLVLEEHLPPDFSPERLPDGTKTTDFEGFVRLVARCKPIVTWS